MDVIPSPVTSADIAQKDSLSNVRRTSSGRPFPQKYANDTAQSTITHGDDSRAVGDLEETSKQERIVNLVDQIKAAGFETPFDFFLEFLQCTPPEGTEPLKNWLCGDGMPSFIETCTSHDAFRPSDAFNSLVIRLAKVNFTKEMRKLAKLPSLRQPLASLTFDLVSDFSPERFQNELDATAPTLLSLLESLVLLPARQSTAIRSDLNPESDSEPEEETTSPIQSIGRLPEIAPSPQKSRSRRLAVQMSLSVLLYARSQKCNLIPGLLGYFLHSSRVPKRAIEALHRFGVSVSYESVISGMKSIAADSGVELRKLAATFPPLFAYVDNMNFYARVRDQRLDNQAEMQNYTVGYIGLNPHPPGLQMVRRENPLDRLRTLGAEQLLPSDENLAIYSQNCWAGISGVLHTYCGPNLELRGARPRSYTAMFKLPKEPTKIFTLPAYDKNEAIIDEMTEVLRLVMQALGYTREQLLNWIIPFCGDYLTVRNIRLVPLCRLNVTDSARIAITRTMESIPRDHLDHFEPIAGMFHLQMAVLNLLFQVHMGDKSDVNSLAKWFIILKRDSNIFGTGKRRTIKDFRACNQLFNHVLDAHVLAIVGTKLEVDSCAELCKALERRKWRKAFEETDDPLTDLNYIDTLRSSDKRDRVYENGLLFLQHGLIYRDFSDAMRSGDSGRIKNCLTFFMLWFQGSKFGNYAGELLHLVACLNHIWSTDMRMSWYRNVLVNFSGSEEGFMAADLLGEFVVREIKAWKTATITSTSGEYLRTIMAPQVLLCSRIRDKISREIGATQYYKHSSSVNAWYDVRTVANSLLKDRAFTFMSERRLPSNDTSPAEVTDVYTKGKLQVWNGRVIDRYVRKRLEALGENICEDTDELELAELDEDRSQARDELDLDTLDEEEGDGDAIQEMMDGLL
jgi:hypothetical protein